MERRKLREELIWTHKALCELNMELFFTKNIFKKTRPTW